MNKNINNKSKIKGITIKRLYNTKRFYELLISEGIKFKGNIKSEVSNGSYNLPNIYKVAIKELGKEKSNKILEKSAKKLFKSNFIGDFILNKFQRDIKIPLLTGYFTVRPLVKNLVTTRGKEIVAEQLGGTTTAPVTAIALGTGTTAAAAGDTSLETEISSGGGSRGASTVTNETTTTTKDTEQWVKTFNFTSTFAVTEEGLFDNNTIGGNMLARQVFSAINVSSGDSLQVTHKVQIT